MENKVINVVGFPSDILEVKLRRFIEKYTGPESIDGIERRDDGETEITFKTAENCRQFCESNVNKIDFGENTYQLTFLSRNKHREQFVRKDDEKWRVNLYVGKIPHHMISKRQMEEHFARFGALVDVQLFPARQFAFIKYKNHDDALLAKKNGRNVHNHGPQLSISWANKESDHGEQSRTVHSRRGNRRRPASADMSKQQNKSKISVRQPSATGTSPRQTELQYQKCDDSKTFYWNTILQLPSPGGTMCILVQNIDPGVHTQNIILHFENKKRSNGGPVKCILKLIDGVLVIFTNSSDCEQVLSRNGQELNGRKLKIYPKVIPTFYENKFVIAGVGENTSKSTLELFLENCSRHEITPELCEQQVIPGVYLIEYGDDFDSSETNSLMSAIIGKPLEGNKISVKRLLKSDCLKVGNIPADTSNDTLRLLFESKKRTDGGQVTKISRTKDHVLIYFALFEDAKRIYDKYKPLTAEHILIGENQLTVQMYFHSLANDHFEVEQESMDFPNLPAKHEDTTLEAFHYLLKKIKQSILNFIQGSDKHMQRLHDSFEGLATVVLSAENAEMICTPNTEERKEFRTQMEYEKECENRLKIFFSKYTMNRKQFDKKKISTLRAYKLFPELNEDYTDESENVMIYWKKDNILELTGLKENVDSVNDHLNECMESTIADMPIDEDQYRKLVKCGIVEELKGTHNDVKLITDDEKRKITIVGKQHVVSNVQIEALTMLTTIKKKTLAELDLEEPVRVFFGEYIKKESSNESFEKRFQEKNLKLCIILEDGELHFYLRSNDFQEVTRCVNAFIKTNVLWLEEGISGNVLMSSEWKKFQQRTETSRNIRILIQTNSSLLLVGLPNEMSSAYKDTKKFLDENMNVVKIVPTEFGCAKFALEKSGQFTAAMLKKKSITECRLTSEMGGGIYVKGKKCTLDKAVSSLKATVENVVSSQHNLYDAGLNEYFKGEQGEQFLKNTENSLTCIILTSANPETWPEEMVTSMHHSPFLHGPAKQSETSEKLASVQVSDSGSVLQLWKDNIIEHKCGIIVNASNPELQLLCEGVSGVIREIDVKNGNVIQNQMRKIIEQNRGSLQTGEAELTSSGGLKHCKKIIHAIGPRWNQTTQKNDPKRVLKACIFQILTTAETTRLKTIAIPAISCGAFGGKVSVCIPLIVEATVEYFKETPQSCIKEVHFIERSEERVLKAFQKEITFLHQHSPAHAKPTPFPRATKRIVSLVQGNIADQTADVIVNITVLHPNFMRGSAISKALAIKAGQGIESQVQLPSSNMSIVETTAGQLSCRKLYHGFVTKYNNQNSETLVRFIVSRCLQNAETDQLRSIVFPAIATGGFHHPPHLVAKWMKDEISKFTGKSLQNITIVLFPSDHNSIAAFTAEFNSSQVYVTPHTPHQKVASSSISIGPLTVSVYQGDITQERSDAIVNNTDNSFDLSRGMVSQSIASKGGPGIQAQLSLTAGNDFRVTSGGNLPCKHIYHIVANSEHDIKTLLVKLLGSAEKNEQIASVSIPALGTGNLGLTSSSVANTMRQAFQKFASNNPATITLRQVNIVVFDRTLLQDFKDAVLHTQNTGGFFARIKAFATKQSIWPSGKESSTKQESRNSLEVNFYSNSKETNDKALQYIQNEIRKVVHTQQIEDDTIKDLTELEKWEIDQVEEKHQVNLKYTANKYLNRIQIQGLTHNVLSANEEIMDILRNFKEAETCSHFVTWKRFVASNGWEEYPARANYVLEKAYKAFKKENGPSIVKVPMFDQGSITENRIDLKSMDSQSAIIRRDLKEGESTELPNNWDDMGTEQCKRVVLSPGSPEYSTVLTSFQGNVKFFTKINKIERVQHISQYKQYMAKKIEVGKKLKNCGSSNILERRVFHGTSDYDKIIDNGFDRSYAGKNATVYGRGVYFAIDSQYSHGYTDGVRNRRMFLADVITGDYCQGHSSYVAPPVKPGGMKNDLYDSVVDNMASPRIFVIFKDASAYPTYLITYC